MTAASGSGAMAISAVDIALWDLKARLLGVPLADLLPRFSNQRSGLWERRLHLLLRRAASRPALGLGRSGNTAREDEGRPGPRRRPGARRGRARGRRRRVELMVDANGAYTPARCARVGASASRFRRHLLRGAGHLRRPRGAGRFVREHAPARHGDRGRRVRLAICPTSERMLDAGAVRHPAGRCHALRRHHQPAPRRTGCARRATCRSRPTARPRCSAHAAARWRQSCTSSTSTTTSVWRACFSTARRVRMRGAWSRTRTSPASELELRAGSRRGLQGVRGWPLASPRAEPPERSAALARGGPVGPGMTCGRPPAWTGWMRAGSQRELQATLRGEVHFDPGYRAIYSHDSLQLPTGTARGGDPEGRGGRRGRDRRLPSAWRPRASAWLWHEPCRRND